MKLFGCFLILYVFLSMIVVLCSLNAEFHYIPKMVN